MKKIGCAILAGGKNSRMGGRDKAFIRIQGRPVIERILTAVTPLFDEILVISNNPGAYSRYHDLRISRDKIPEKGPLGGLYTALSLTLSDALFVLACDMPDIATTLMRSMCDLYWLNPSKQSFPGILYSLKPTDCEDLSPYLPSTRRTFYRSWNRWFRNQKIFL